MTQGTVAYLGPQGTFSEEAAILFAPESERLPYPSIRDAAMAAESRETDEAVLPIENSIEGAVNMTLDYLIHDSTLSIVGELVLPIGQCLIVTGRVATGGHRDHQVAPPGPRAVPKILGEKLPQREAHRFNQHGRRRRRGPK